MLIFATVPETYSFNPHHHHYYHHHHPQQGFDSSSYYAPNPRERYFRAAAQRRALEQSFYPFYPTTSRSSAFYDSYAYEQAALARERLQQQRQQQEFVAALRQAQLRKQEAERRRRELVLQSQREQQLELAAALLTTLFGDESEKPQPEQKGCDHCGCGCHKDTRDQHNRTAIKGVTSGPSFPPFAFAFGEPATQSEPAKETQSSANLKRNPAIYRRCSGKARAPPATASTTPTPEQKKKDDIPASPTQRSSLENLGLIRGEFDIARMQAQDSTPGESGKVYEEKLLRMLERLDGVESDGDESVRTVRRSLARDLSFALDAVDEARSTGSAKGKGKGKEVHFEEEKPELSGKNTIPIEGISPEDVIPRRMSTQSETEAQPEPAAEEAVIAVAESGVVTDDLSSIFEPEIAGAEEEYSGAPITEERDDKNIDVEVRSVSSESSVEEYVTEADAAFNNVIDPEPVSGITQPELQAHTTTVEARHLELDATMEELDSSSTSTSSDMGVGEDVVVVHSDAEEGSEGSSNGVKEKFEFL